MEVYPRSSWFLLLLGFALIAATLQETPDCPKPDQVSCTDGIKCSSDLDCQEKEICCANACYTKRCTPNPIGVQGEAETDGPSETDCRPYIEKALKELEIGEVGHTHKEPSDHDESAEDIPTVEITDDSSHQEEDGGQGEASEEAEAGEEQSAESIEEGEAQQEAAKGSTEDNKSGEDSGETPDKKEVEKSKEQAESDEDTKTGPSERESAEENEQADEQNLEESKEEQVLQETPDTASAEIEEQSVTLVPIVPGSQEDEQSTEDNKDQSEEKKDESQEKGESNETPQGDSKEESAEAAAEENADSKEGDDEKADDKSDEDETKRVKREAAEESNEDRKSKEQPTASEESTETGGCPAPGQVSCTEGDLCSKHRNCGEDQICCPNKCYRKRCIPGTVSDAELEAESASEETQEDTKSEEKYVPTTPETGCPSPGEVSCTEGELCSKHKQCGEEKICCPNKCYRKRCIEGTATSAELEAESDEDSKESTEEKEQKETADKTPETGCPSPGEVSCTEGELCSKHKQCGEEKICCPNKCYRKRCIEGTATSAELEAESDEDSKESTEEKEQKETADKTPETGCPSPGEVSCTEGELCSKHKQCGEEKICCPNKCYRKRCIEGTATSAELEAESDEDSKEESTEEKEQKETADKIPETGCPSPSEVSCTEGELCAKHKHCDENTICCPNRCYRKRCTPGTATEEELAIEESEGDSTEQEDKVTSGEKQTTETVIESGCPEPSKVSCTEGELCSKHKQCGEEKICCPNKCYRRRCMSGTATLAELEAESDEDSKEESKEASLPEKPVRKSSDTGCPERDEVSCRGEKCAKNKECDAGEICCANKCYRKVCISGTPGSEEEHESEEVTQDKSAEDIVESVEAEEEGDCPSPNKVSCTEGQKCGDDEDCNGGEICCRNKCYTKRCVPGPEGDGDESDKEEEPAQKVVLQSKSREIREVKETIQEQIKIKAAPPPPEPKKEVPKPEAAKPEPKKPEAAKPEAKKPEATKPEATKPEAAKPEAAKPEATKPEAKKPEVRQPEVIQPEVRQPEVQQPEVIRAAKPKAPSKPVKVVELIVEEEDDESLEQIGEAPVEDLSLDTDMPTELRPREHVEHLLKLDKDSSKLENVQNRVYEETLKELKKLYEHAIKPLETLYKYRDLSNRHFGDAEIFSKPLILFMGPWSGGKSSIINYLINNEYNETSLRTGAEPSPAYFNILTYGDEPDIIDGTELAADFTFSGLQKFGQGLEERLRGVKLPSKLLERVNIVEIPGILEVRKQVSRVFPFNDACQWFIDRADIIFLVYDPSKLDVGPETEAILDQLKGREHQTRIVLNKADQVKPEELMRVQGALIWNISPLMSSPQPPVMYTTSLWSRPYEPWAPVRLLQAQERAFLRDLRTAVDRRVENKIASARRFAVRVRNHAKMVDCYLTTYYNHKSVFGNRKQVANEIIDHPQDYHIYEGLSTLTNISRYDLPDPDVYRDFFKLNPLYEFQQLSATCTYFRGCPINRLDIAIAYDLPELVGTYKRNLEEALTNANNPPKEPPSPPKTKKSAPGS